MKNTDARHHILLFLPSPEKEERGKSGLKKKTKNKTFQQQVEGEKSLRQKDTVRLLVQKKHPPPRSLQNVPFAAFPSFLLFAPSGALQFTCAAQPLMITAATKQESKYGREERRDEGCREALCGGFAARRCLKQQKQRAGGGEVG